ncbi:MAG: HEAT repeat domain-containing protein [Phycisphaerales bacterium]|nr:HEAT repeat domain-containing protein [Phycisphaerales bacterium]
MRHSDCARTRSRLACSFLLLLVALSTARGDTQFIPDRPWDLTHLKLELKVDLEKRHLDGIATVDLRATRQSDAIELNAVDLNITQVTFARGSGSAIEAKYDATGKQLKIPLDGLPTKPGDTAQVRVSYSVSDPKEGLHFFAPCEGDPGIPLQVWSQGQSIDNRRWIPCFDDPGEMQTSELIVTVPGGNEVLSNGRLESREDNPDGTVTFHWLQDKPHASYLITLVVGKFAVVREEWRGKPVLYYVPPGKESQAQNAFGRTRRMLDLFSQKTGVEYPWDKYAQVCAEQFGGGMENTSATTLGTGVLHDDRAHLDTDVDDLISHELAHQWFGDLVTCRSWSHVWLNEGFASLFEAIWAQEAGGRDAAQTVLHRFREQALVGAAEAPVVDRDYKNPNDMFDARVYQKAGFMLHVLMERMGEDVFWRGVKEYLTRFRHRPVETHDFRRVMEEAYGGSLERFFYDWTERDDQPRIHIEYAWDADAGSAKIDIRQKQDGDPFELPLEFDIEDAGGAVTRKTYQLDEKSETLDVKVSSEPRRVSFDPRQLILGDVKIELPHALWIAELAGGSSVSGRIRAAKELGESKSPEDVAVMSAQLAAEPYHAIAGVIAEQLARADTPEARAALMKGLDARDPRIRSACASRLGKVGEDEEGTQRLHRLITAGDPSYEVEADAIESWAQRHPPDAVAFLTSLLNRDSQDEVIRRAIFRGLSEQHEPAAAEPLLAWVDRGKPSLCRRSAVQSLARYVEKQEPDKDLLKRIVAALTPFLSGESDRFLGGVISALGQIGKPAADALPRLRELAASHGSDHVRRAAERAIAQIEPKREQGEDDKQGKAGDKGKKRRKHGDDETPPPAENAPPPSKRDRKKADRNAAHGTTEKDPAPGSDRGEPNQEGSESGHD